MDAGIACVNTSIVVSSKPVRLRASDLEAVLRVIEDANELATDDNAFPAETLADLAEVVPCDDIGVFAVDRVRRRCIPFDGEQDDRWWEIAHQSPICEYVERSGDFRALKFSDFLTRPQLHRLELYDECLRPVNCEYWIVLPLRTPPWHERGFNLIRGGRDFSERDRQVLDLLAPHLVRLMHRVELRQRLAVALAALDAGAVDQGIVLLDPNGRLEHATPHARALLAKYFPPVAAGFPQAVTDWLAHGTHSLVRARGKRRIVIDQIGPRLLVREEPVKAAKIAALTPREQQVLEWVAQGRTNAEIAAILVTAPGTVRKHLENIYAKLGVHTRTAAAAFAHSRLAAA
jgi:DNA-binding CsgD family transcriptional regulator